MSRIADQLLWPLLREVEREVYPSLQQMEAERRRTTPRPPTEQPVRIPIYALSGKIVAYALVDRADAEWALQSTWRLHRDGYATRTVSGRALLMHRALLGLAHGDARQCDHVNRNGLDNRRANLRVVTKAQNAQNVSSHRGSTSRYRGVYRDKHGRWAAQVRFGGSKHHLGTFGSEAEAAAVASAFRKRHLPHSNEEPAERVLEDALLDRLPTKGT